MRADNLFALCYHLSPNSSSNGRSNQTCYLEHTEELAAKMRLVWAYKNCTHAYVRTRACVCNSVVSKIIRTPTRVRHVLGGHTCFGGGGSHVPSPNFFFGGGGHMYPPLKNLGGGVTCDPPL